MSKAKRIFYTYAFDAEKALKEGDFGTSNFTRIDDYDYFMVNPNVKDYPIEKISEQNIMMKPRTDYWEDAGQYIIYFLRNQTFDDIDKMVLLRKNKIYKIPNVSRRSYLTPVEVEFGEKYNICDTHYEMYLFIKEEDIEVARKQLELNLKIKKLNGISN